MSTIDFTHLSSNSLISLPDYFRNDSWSSSYGNVQRTLLTAGGPREVTVDASKCLWIDPLPMLSVIISLHQMPANFKKIFILKDRANQHPEQCRVMSFLEKEGFLDEIRKTGTEISLKNESGELEPYSEADRTEYKNYENSLKYSDSTILKAMVVDLKEKISEGSLENWIDQLLLEHDNFTHKITATSKNEIYGRIGLFLKETLDNVYEHAYTDENDKKMAGIFIRFRKGLADNSLDSSTRAELKRTIDDEHNHSPTLRKYFLDDVSSFIEIFIVDSGIGIAESFYRNKEKPKFPFRGAWGETIGHGKRREYATKIKNTRYGGLFTLSRLLDNNYLTARDYNEWIGDVLPIIGNNPKVDANRSYLITGPKPDSVQVTGLGLIGRVTWKSASDEHSNWGHYEQHLSQGADGQSATEHPFLEIIGDERDIYVKYLGKTFKSLPYNPFYVRDDKYHYSDELLAEKYLEIDAPAEFCLYFPKDRITKNSIHAIIDKEFLRLNSKSRTLIIGDIPVWETNVYQLALQDATYSRQFLDRFDTIILISRRLSVLLLKKTGDTFRYNALAQQRYIKKKSAAFNPAESLQHYIEWARTHDSMIFWQYLNHSNLLSEYYINSKIEWYQGQQEVALYGYLNFSKTLTDSFCMQIYENALERTLCLNNAHGCHYESIDVLTNKLCQQFNSLFYNRVSKGARTIFLGSVVVTGYSAIAAQPLDHQLAPADKIHFFYNLNSDLDKLPGAQLHLLLWPIRGKEWFADNVNNEEVNINKGRYRRIGASHVIAPAGWKYFPVPRYKLFNTVDKRFIDVFTPGDVEQETNKFISIYKCDPKETYKYWQGKKNETISVAHVYYENNHDLFRIDFPYILDESFTLGDNLAIFLLGEFLLALNKDDDPAAVIKCDNDKLVEGVRGYIKNERSNFKKADMDCAIIVYPYHYHAEHAINLIKRHLPDGYHNRIIAIFPVNKDRYGSTFLPSPITLETISATIEKYKQETGLVEVNALLFDDATIGGKTRSDINHILYSLDIKNIKTVSILERTRLPFSTSYPFKHKAFWRLDIPKLGDDDSCPICRVFRELDDFANILISKNALERLASWREVWHKSSPFEIKGKKIITPVLLNLPDPLRFKKFGIYWDGAKHQQCGGDDNRIELTTSIGLSIYTAELHSMTSRDDLVLQYLNRRDLSNSAKLEMLCVNMLLFGKESSRIVQQKIIAAIYVLAEQSEENNLTAMAAITLLAQPREKLEVLFAEAKDIMERDVQIKNFDMQIVLSKLSAHHDSQFSGSKILTRLHIGFQNLQVLYKQFHAELYNDFGLAHDTPLQVVIREFNSSLRIINAIEDSFDKVLFLFNHIPAWYLRRDNPGEDEKTDRHIQDTEQFLIDSKLFLADTTNDLHNEETVKEFKAIVKTAVEGLKEYHEKLFLCVNGLNAVKFGEVLALLIERNAMEEVGVTSQIPTPFNSPDFSNWICWDRDTVRMVVSLIGNVRHNRVYAIPDPFDADSKVLNKAWLNVEITEHALLLKMVNQSEECAAVISDKTAKRNKPEKMHLKELDILISYRDLPCEQGHLVETLITFPYLNTY